MAESPVPPETGGKIAIDCDLCQKPASEIRMDRCKHCGKLAPSGYYCDGCGETCIFDDPWGHEDCAPAVPVSVEAGDEAKIANCNGQNCYHLPCQCNGPDQSGSSGTDEDTPEEVAQLAYDLVGEMFDRRSRMRMVANAVWAAALDWERTRIAAAIQAEADRWERLGYDDGGAWISSVKIAKGELRRG